MIVLLPVTHWLVVGDGIAASRSYVYELSMSSGR